MVTVASLTFADVVGSRRDGIVTARAGDRRPDVATVAEVADDDATVWLFDEDAPDGAPPIGVQMLDLDRRFAVDEPIRAMLLDGTTVPVEGIPD